MRIAVFLHAVGIKPAYEGQNWTEILELLFRQYMSLPAELQREARQQGRELIRGKSLAEAAAGIVPDLSPMPQQRKHPKVKHSRPPEHALPKCPYCRSWGPRFKAIWEDRAAAEDISIHFNDPGLLPYPCPHGNGWHIGHLPDHPHDSPPLARMV